MFVIVLTYKAPLEEIDRHLEAHRAFLNRYYASGNFIVSGPQNPREGGVILCRATDRKEVEKILSEDPFNAVAEYSITEFLPTKYAAGFELCTDK
ncbi:MAG: YciI family protein [Bacteroidales bacterium]|nr:YciI family protein [Bacteroidales bacterium]